MHAHSYSLLKNGSDQSQTLAAVVPCWSIILSLTPSFDAQQRPPQRRPPRGRRPPNSERKLMAFDAAVEPSNEALPKILSEHKQRVVNCGGNNPQPQDAIKQPSIFNLRMA